MVILKPGDLNRVAETVKNRRKALAMSQAELAEKSGVDQSTIAYIESGKRIPSLINLLSIMNELDLVLRIEIENTEQKNPA